MRQGVAAAPQLPLSSGCGRQHTMHRATHEGSATKPPACCCASRVCLQARAQPSPQPPPMQQAWWCPGASPPPLLPQPASLAATYRPRPSQTRSTKLDPAPPAAWPCPHTARSAEQTRWDRWPASRQAEAVHRLLEACSPEFKMPNPGPPEHSVDGSGGTTCTACAKAPQIHTPHIHCVH